MFNAEIKLFVFVLIYRPTAFDSQYIRFIDVIELDLHLIPVIADRL